MTRAGARVEAQGPSADALLFDCGRVVMLHTNVTTLRITSNASHR
jgi:hypothetical protein